MREIKFRGQRIDNGKWVYGYLFYDFDCTDKYAPFINWKDNRYLGGIGEEEIEEEGIGQYTGLKDKNGKEIYEGDILKLSDIDTAIVKWNKEYASFIVKPIEDYYFDDDILGKALYYNKDIVVIGNIYENPELLKEA